MKFSDEYSCEGWRIEMEEIFEEVVVVVDVSKEHFVFE